jgi:hypothetical protein
MIDNTDNNNDERVIDILIKRRLSTYNDLFNFQGSAFNIDYIIDILTKFKINVLIINELKNTSEDNLNVKYDLIYITRTYNNKNQFVIVRALLCYIKTTSNVEFKSEFMETSTFSFKNTPVLNLKTGKKNIISTIKNICGGKKKQRCQNVQIADLQD